MHSYIFAKATQRVFPVFCVNIIMHLGIESKCPMRYLRKFNSLRKENNLPNNFQCLIEFPFLRRKGIWFLVSLYTTVLYILLFGICDHSYVLQPNNLSHSHLNVPSSSLFHSSCLPYFMYMSYTPSNPFKTLTELITQKQPTPICSTSPHRCLLLVYLSPHRCYLLVYLSGAILFISYHKHWIYQANFLQRINQIYYHSTNGDCNTLPLKMSSS